MRAGGRPGCTRRSAGRPETALQLFEWANSSRDSDGRYWTGTVYPQNVNFPAEEKSTYTSAAIILTADALSGTTAASGLFSDHSALPAIAELITTETD